MDQNQPMQPSPQPQVVEPTIPVSTPKKMTGRTKLALWLLIGPTSLFVITMLLYVVTNFILASPATAPTNGQLFADPSPVQAITNISLFIMTIIVFLTWLPGIITGIILLATKK